MKKNRNCFTFFGCSRYGGNRIYRNQCVAHVGAGFFPSRIVAKTRSCCRIKNKISLEVIMFDLGNEK